MKAMLFMMSGAAVAIQTGLTETGCRNISTVVMKATTPQGMSFGIKGRSHKRRNIQSKNRRNYEPNVQP